MIRLLSTLLAFLILSSCVSHKPRYPHNLKYPVFECEKKPRNSRANKMKKYAPVKSHRPNIK